MPSRNCRPVGLSEAERRAVTSFAIALLGHRYDLKNVIDLARYLLPTPPVPTRICRPHRSRVFAPYAESLGKM